MDAKRAKVIAYNEIIIQKEDSFYDYNEEDFKERVLEELGITEEEYNEIMEN